MQLERNAFYHVPTFELYMHLMLQFEKQGYSWNTNRESFIVDHEEIWSVFGEDTLICLRGRVPDKCSIFRNSLSYYHKPSLRSYADFPLFDYGKHLRVSVAQKRLARPNLPDL